MCEEEQRELQAREEEGLLSGEETDECDQGEASGLKKDENQAGCSEALSGEEMDQASGFKKDGCSEALSGEEMDQGSELESLRRQVHALKMEKEAGWICNLKAESVKGDDVRCRELTGLSWSVFQSLSSYLMPFVEDSKSKQLSQEDQLFIVLLKLRLNPSCSLLSHALNMGQTTLRDMFDRWINLLYAFNTLARQGVHSHHNASSYESSVSEAYL